MKRPRILVVDDQLHIARITGMLLGQGGKYEIALETCPAQVLEVVRQFSPDVIVLDHNMPGKTGREVAQEIWSDQSLTPPGILFFCGLVPPVDPILQETARGPFLFISKTIPSHGLFAAVEEMIQDSSKVESSVAHEHAIDSH